VATESPKTRGKEAERKPSKKVDVGSFRGRKGGPGGEASIGCAWKERRENGKQPRTTESMSISIFSRANGAKKDTWGKSINTRGDRRKTWARRGPGERGKEHSAKLLKLYDSRRIKIGGNEVRGRMLDGGLNT